MVPTRPLNSVLGSPQLPACASLVLALQLPRHQLLPPSHPAPANTTPHEHRQTQPPPNTGKHRPMQVRSHPPPPPHTCQCKQWVTHPTQTYTHHCKQLIAPPPLPPSPPPPHIHPGATSHQPFIQPAPSGHATQANPTPGPKQGTHPVVGLPRFGVAGEQTAELAVGAFPTVKGETGQANTRYC